MTHSLRKTLIPALLAIASLGSAAPLAFGADTEATKFYKALPPIEGQMVRALHSVFDLFMTGVDYAPLDTLMMLHYSQSDYGDIAQLRPRDFDGLSFAPSNDHRVAVVSIQTATCPEQLASMRASLLTLGMVKSSQQALCRAGAIVVESDPHN